jgi:3-hydroxyacyl-CoA dehydrogenase
VNWADAFIHSVGVGGLGILGYKITNLLALRKPKQVSDINKQLREELRKENQELRGTIAEQAKKIEKLKSDLATYKIDTVTTLMKHGVAPEVIGAVIET